MSQIQVEKTIFELLQEVRFELSKIKLEKTGYNKHLNFKYFELGDFLAKAIELLNNKGLCPIFNISYDSNGIEMATLTLVKGAERIVFTTPTDSPTNVSGIQALGAKHTYLKRYLYINLLDLIENDVVNASLDENSNNSKVEEKKATDKQIEMITGLYDEENINKILDYYKIDSLQKLSIKQASQIIAKKKGQ